MKRIPALLLAVLCTFLATQCVSPLDPDTPRVFTPGEGNDNADDTLRADLVKARFRMNGSLLGIPGQGRIQEWPTLVMKPDSQQCEVDTTHRPNRFTIRTHYAKTMDIDSLVFHSDDLHIYGVNFRIDSLPLPAGNVPVLLDGTGAARRSFVELQVVYSKANAAGERKRESVSSQGNNENNDVVMSECMLVLVKYDEREERYHIRFECVLTKTSTQSKFRYFGEIVLTVVP